MKMGSLVSSKHVGKDHKSPTDSGQDETQSTTSSNGKDKDHNQQGDQSLKPKSESFLEGGKIFENCYNGSKYFTGPKQLCINSIYHYKHMHIIIKEDWDNQDNESDSEDTSIYDTRPTFQFGCGGSYTGQWKGQMRHGYGT